MFLPPLPPRSSALLLASARSALAPDEQSISDATEPTAIAETLLGLRITVTNAARGQGGRILFGGNHDQDSGGGDARVPLSRADPNSPADHAAARALAAGSGIQAAIEATGLRTLKNVLALINPAILERARRKDAAPPPATEPARPR